MRKKPVEIFEEMIKKQEIDKARVEEGGKTGQKVLENEFEVQFEVLQWSWRRISEEISKNSEKHAGFAFQNQNKTKQRKSKTDKIVQKVDDGWR